MDDQEYRETAYAEILKFCSTSTNDLQREAVAAALPNMSMHDIELLNYVVTTAAEDDFAYLGVDDVARSFFASCLIDHSNGQAGHPSDVWYGAMWECIVSLAQARNKYALGSTPETSRAYLDLTLALFLANDFDAPSDQQLIMLVHGRSNRSYQRVRDRHLLLIVDRHPEWCDDVIRLVVHHGVRHAPAIEAAIIGSAEPALASGVL